MGTLVGPAGATAEEPSVGTHAPVACQLTAPTAFKRALVPGKDRRITLPKTRLASVDDECHADLRLRGRVTARSTLAVLPGTSTRLRLRLPKAALRALPAKATLTLVLTAPGYPTQKLTWHVRIAAA